MPSLTDIPHNAFLIVPHLLHRRTYINDYEQRIEHTLGVMKLLHLTCLHR